MSDDFIKNVERYNQDRLAPARLEYYLKAAQARKETATNDELVMIRILEGSIQTAHQAILKNDIDDLLQAFERVIKYTVKLNLTDYETDIKRKQAAKGGKGKRDVVDL